MNGRWVIAGAVFAGLGVAAGAFGAHALAGRLEPDLLEVFATGARYQLIHALALLFVGLAAERSPGWRWEAAGWLFVAGILIFAGSLYVLALTGLRWMGAITPIGGACFLAGWAAVALAVFRDPGPCPERRGSASSS